jgi:DNA-binding CsgD family transcriptional regulator
MASAHNIDAARADDRPRPVESSEAGHASWCRFVTSVASRLQPLTGTRDEEPVLETVVDGVRYSLRRSVVTETELAPVALSAREHEIACMVAKGYTNKTIAAVLEISLWTVDTYLRRIYRKLDVRTRSAMVGRLASAGVVDTRETPDWSKAWRERVARR